MSPKAQTDFQRLYRRLDEADRLLNQKTSALEKQHVLAARAKAIAKAREQARAETVDVLAFQVGGERYAVAIEAVEQVVEPKMLSSLPGVPRYVLGAMLARSRVILVVDLRQLLGLEGGGMSDLVRVVVVTIGDTRVGIAAELVDGRMDLPKEGARKPNNGPFAFITPDRLAVIDLTELGRVLADGQKT